MSSTRLLIMTLFMALFTSVFCGSSAMAESNCFIRFLSEPAGGLTAEELIASYGGRIVHTLPDNEYICDMRPRQFDKFVLTENAQGLHRDTVQ